jgi:hypothetical protein
MSTTPASVAAPREPYTPEKLARLRECIEHWEEAERQYKTHVPFQISDTAAFLRELSALRLELEAARGDAGRWVPWNYATDEPPASGTYITTVGGRGYRAPFRSMTGTADFYKDDVIAYWSAPLAPPYAALPAPPSKDAGA